MNGRTGWSSIKGCKPVFMMNNLSKVLFFEVDSGNHFWRYLELISTTTRLLFIRNTWNGSRSRDFMCVDHSEVAWADSGRIACCQRKKVVLHKKDIFLRNRNRGGKFYP